jgi:hypothetical protein
MTKDYTFIIIKLDISSENRSEINKILEKIILKYYYQKIYYFQRKTFMSFINIQKNLKLIEMIF